MLIPLSTSLQTVLTLARRITDTSQLKQNTIGNRFGTTIIAPSKIDHLNQPLSQVCVICHV
jgi:hypothetical protein